MIFFAQIFAPFALIDWAKFTSPLFTNGKKEKDLNTVFGGKAVAINYSAILELPAFPKNGSRIKSPLFRNLRIACFPKNVLWIKTTPRMMWSLIFLFDSFLVKRYNVAILPPRVRIYNIMAINKKQLTPRQNVARRLKIAEGHIKKIIEMVESDVYCIDVLQQTSAVRSAIKKAEEVLLLNHLNHCLIKAINSNNKEKAFKELLEVFRKKG